MSELAGKTAVPRKIIMFSLFVRADVTALGRGLSSTQLIDVAFGDIDRAPDKLLVNHDAVDKNIWTA